MSQKLFKKFQQACPSLDLLALGAERIPAESGYFHREN
jgi:hypothetical protein